MSAFLHKVFWIADHSIGYDLDLRTRMLAITLDGIDIALIDEKDPLGFKLALSALSLNSYGDEPNGWAFPMFGAVVHLNSFADERLHLFINGLLVRSFDADLGLDQQLAILAEEWPAAVRKTASAEEIAY